MTTLTLVVRNGHYFVNIDGNLWLIDTGATSSFGETPNLSICGETFELASNYLGLTAKTLSEMVGDNCVGLIGTNILSRFDLIFDTIDGNFIISKDELSHTGQSVFLNQFKGIPIVSAHISGTEYQMFLDTGAQLSYFQNNSIREFPASGVINDFYPGFGEFQTETHEVPITLGGIDFMIRCGTLPGLLGMTLMMENVQGVIGNAIFANRIVGYFPRQCRMVL